MKITRRTFAQGLTATGAFSLLPELGARQANNAGRTLGYCIVGLGRISMGHFMPACKMSQKSRVTALVSGHRDKADKMAAQYNVPTKNIYSYENYDEIAANPDIDAVYIALPNSMHAEYTARAAKAAKHVLCEKPMATTVKDSQDMIAACKTANKKLMIAYRCQYEPMNLHAIELIKKRQTGEHPSHRERQRFQRARGRMAAEQEDGRRGPIA